MKKTTWSAALCFSDLARITDTVLVLSDTGCTEWHIDITDGVFAPGFTLGADTIRCLKSVSEIPIHAHLMVEYPERHIADIIAAGASRVTIHVESTPHVNRAMNMIKELGAQAGIAIQPATALTKLEYVLSQADFVHVITEARGVERKMPLASTFDRIKILRENLNYLESRATLSVEGYMTAKNAASAIVHGADCIVWDNAAVFAPGSLMDNVEGFKELVKHEVQIA